MKKSTPPKLKTFSAAKQARMDELLDKNREGTISPVEKAALKKLVDEAERLMAANAKRLAEFSNKQVTGLPAGSVPVTVWIKADAPGAIGHESS